MSRQGDAPGGRAAVPAPKIRVPDAHPTLVHRDRLLTLFTAGGSDEDGHSPLTLLSAPAGSGKTTLLTEWAHEHRSTPERHVAWVSLDADDNGIFLLWSAMLAALEATGVWRQGDDPLRRLSPPQDTMEAGFLTTLVGALDELSEPVWLVLDDLHELHDPQALHSIDLLLRHLPRQLRLVLSARFEPPVGLHRLRVEGRLREIGADQLTFTRDEAALLLAGAQITLADTDLDLLLERTEGWAAGLRLAALSLVDAADPAVHVAEFAGDDRAVADYLVGEILSHQPEYVREFLLTVSGCADFTVELAAELSGRDDAGDILDRLERANALVVRPDRTGNWYRPHPLLRGYLRGELGRRDAGALPRLDGVAARWFAAQGMPLRALEHAVDAGDPDLAAEIVESTGLAQIMDGDGATLRRLLEGLPAEVMAGPAVALVAAIAALDAGDVATADARLASVGNSVDEHDSPRLRALHATIAVHRARLGGDISAAMETLADIADTGDPDLDLLALVNRGTALLWLGEHHAGQGDLEAALTLATARHRDSTVLHCLIHLATVAAAETDLPAMAERTREAIAFATERGWEHTSRCAYAYGLGAWAAYQRLDHDTAQRFAPLAVELLEGQSDPTVELTAHSMAAIVGFDAAPDRHAVVAALRDHWLRLGGEQLTPSLIGYEAPVEQRLALRVGEFGWATEVADRVEELLGGRGGHDGPGEAVLLRAALHVHKGRMDQARVLLREIVEGQVESHVVTTVIDAWLLEAVLADRAGDDYRAHRALGEAVELAAPRQALRPFVDAGDPVRELLAGGAGRFGRHEHFAAAALAAMPPRVPAATDVLTPRELELLAELPSMRTTEEIAESLLVSVNTVKTHLRGIYQKLGVNSRRHAITVARQRGLL